MPGRPRPGRRCDDEAAAAIGRQVLPRRGGRDGEVERAKQMDESTMRKGARTAEHCGYTYCLDNPYTELHQLVGEMLARTHALPAGTRSGSQPGVFGSP